MQNMKRIILYFLAVMCIATAYAQRAKHPSLFYTPERIQQAKQRAAAQPEFAEAWKQIKAAADSKLQGRNIRD